MMTSKKLRGVPESTFKMCPVCFSLKTGPKPETMDEAIEKLKADNKRLRERLRDITYDDYDGMDALRGRWPTTYGVRSAHYQADANAWPLNLPDNYRGRILLNVSYGGGSQYEGVQYVDTYEYAEEVADRLQILLDKPFPGFHWRMGTFFNVAPDGQIEIIRRPSTQHFPIMLARIPPLEWKSIVDSVARGEQVTKADLTTKDDE